jgi:molybdopterin converting factor small subunit
VIRVLVLAFARMRELLGRSELTIELAEDAQIRDAWSALLRDFPSVRDASASTRIARNGRLASPDERLSDGDELALLPPVGGG